MSVLRPKPFWVLQMKMPSGKCWHLGTSKDLIALYEDTDKAMQFPTFLEACEFHREFKKKAHANHEKFANSFTVVKIESGN